MPNAIERLERLTDTIIESTRIFVSENDYPSNIMDNKDIRNKYIELSNTKEIFNKGQYIANSEKVKKLCDKLLEIYNSGDESADEVDVDTIDDEIIMSFNTHINYNIGSMVIPLTCYDGGHNYPLGVPIFISEVTRRENNSHSLNAHGLFLYDKRLTRGNYITNRQCYIIPASTKEIVEFVHGVVSIGKVNDILSVLGVQPEELEVTEEERPFIRIPRIPELSIDEITSSPGPSPSTLDYRYGPLPSYNWTMTSSDTAGDDDILH